jgi:hypothetical protein
MGAEGIDDIRSETAGKRSSAQERRNYAGRGYDAFPVNRKTMNPTSARTVSEALYGPIAGCRFCCPLKKGKD